MNQCLLNLVNNAVKFTEQGHVYVKVSLETPDSGPTIRFDIEDTGIGITRDKQQAIFESFSQADESTTRKYGGTGLGLSITKQLTELLGGELTLTSEEGKGSVFSLVIPAGVDVTNQPLLDLCQTYGHQKEGSEKHPPALFSGRVLVAEDIEANQILMASLLTKMGLEVTFARDGKQALDKALAGSYDLILMDIQMPVMNGYEATKTIRQQDGKTPIVALTANAMKGDDQKCIEAGCNDYLAKPIDRRELQNKLTQYLPPRLAVSNQPTDSALAQAHEPKRLGSQEVSIHTLSSEPNHADIHDIINWDRLIDRLGDEDTIREVMPTYIEGSKGHLSELTDAVKAGDCKSIAFHAHAIKGAARNLSLERLSKMANQMENAGRENDIETATLAFNKLRVEVDQVLTMLSQPDWIDKVKSVPRMG